MPLQLNFLLKMRRIMCELNAEANVGSLFLSKKKSMYYWGKKRINQENWILCVQNKIGGGLEEQMPHQRNGFWIF